MSRFIRVLALFAFTVAMAHAQDQVRKFPALTAAGQTAPINLVGSAAQYGTSINAPSLHIAWASVTGSPSVCSFKIYGSLKLVTDNPVFPADYYELSPSQSCTNPTLAGIASADRPAVTLLIDLTLSGGTAPTVTFYYLGKAH